MRLRAAIAAVCVLVTACTSDALPDRIRSATAPTTASGAVPAHAVIGPDTGDGPFTLNLLDGAKVVEVHAGDVSGHLYRVATPDSGTLFPDVDLAGDTVNVSLTGGGDADLSITLDASVAWNLKFSSGVSTLSVDMSAGHLAGFTSLQGISTIDLTAGAPSGAVVLREVGGASVFAVHVPKRTPVSAVLHGGAGTVSLYDRTYSGVSAGQSYSSDVAGPDGYRIDAVGGVSSVTVDSG